MATIHPSLFATPPDLPSIKTRHVAVIGAGAAGIVAARELDKEGHSVVVYEKENQVGGVWIYTPQIEPDLLGIDPIRPVVHSSLYSSLRTNLPRESMGFLDYPFVGRPGESRDPRRFPGHMEVLLYLQDFARDFGIEKMVRFETEVVNVGLVESGKWRVKFMEVNNGGGSGEEIYDAVVVCNGHYTQPRLAEIPGIETWPGKQMHSHNYRVPESFLDQVVVLIGSSASAVDICRDIAGYAKEVHVASRSVADETYEKQLGYDNLWLHSMIKYAREDGTVVFLNGTMVRADVIMHCTGYKYQFPFVETNNVVTVDENRVGPLYKHVFPPVFAPWISFVGIPWKVVPFAMYELQSKWVAGVLSSRITLPSQEVMIEDVKAFYSTLEDCGVPNRYTHHLGESQFEYDDWLAEQCGCTSVEEWRKEMYFSTGKNKRANPETYRDEWEDQHLVSRACEDFVKYSSSSNLSSKSLIQ